jgi:hypothetical protein
MGDGGRSSLGVARKHEQGEEKRVLTDSFLNRRRGICTKYGVSVKPLPAKFGIAVSPSARYTFWCQQHSLRRSMLDSLPSQSLDTAAQRLKQMAIAESQSFESLCDRCSIGNAASDVATGAKEGRRQRILQCEKERICTSHIGVMAAVLYLYVCTRRGDTEVCAVSQTPPKLYPTLQCFHRRGGCVLQAHLPKRVI